MSQINALLVVLDKDVGEPDVRPIISAIRQLKHVVGVTANVAPDCMTASIAHTRVLRAVRVALLDALSKVDP